jgi:hypothetical protein
LNGSGAEAADREQATTTRAILRSSEFVLGGYRRRHSIETIRKTHSSYFSTREQGFERFFSDIVEKLLASSTVASS